MTTGSIAQERFRRAVKDIRDGVLSVHVWGMLAVQEIRLRYRRSTLGPFWLTVSVGVLIAGMGPLYGKLFGQDLSSYFPHLAISYVIWMLISSLINDACMVFITAEGLIKQVNIPLTVHVLRMVWKNILIFFHHALIVLLVMFFYPPPASWQLLLLPFGLLFLAVNGVWIGIILGGLCARFRDVPQIVQSMVQVLFFLTPIMWRSESLGRYRWAAEWNPVNYFLEIIRAPLLGKPLPLAAWGGVMVVTILGFAMALAFFSRYRARIAYWV